MCFMRLGVYLRPFILRYTNCPSVALPAAAILSVGDTSKNSQLNPLQWGRNCTPNGSRFIVAPLMQRCALVPGLQCQPCACSYGLWFRTKAVKWLRCLLRCCTHTGDQTISSILLWTLAHILHGPTESDSDSLGSRTNCERDHCSQWVHSLPIRSYTLAYTVQQPMESDRLQSWFLM